MTENKGEQMISAKDVMASPVGKEVITQLGTTGLLLVALVAGVLWLGQQLSDFKGEVTRQMAAIELRVGTTEGRLPTFVPRDDVRELTHKVDDLGERLRQLDAEVDVLWRTLEEAHPDELGNATRRVGRR